MNNNMNTNMNIDINQLEDDGVQQARLEILVDSIKSGFYTYIEENIINLPRNKDLILTTLRKHGNKPWQRAGMRSYLVKNMYVDDTPLLKDTIVYQVTVEDVLKVKYGLE